MNINNYNSTIYLSRTTAITLLVRLENSDIPYPHSKQCREQLIYYLSYILTDEKRDETVLKIDLEELNDFVTDIETAIRIIKCYSITNNII